MGEFQLFYVVWALLPIALFALTAWAVAKKYFKIPGREYAVDYFKQGMFCLVLFVVSILIDQHFLENFINSLFVELFDPHLFRWLLYPALLFICAQLIGMRKTKKTSAGKRMPGSKYTGHVN